MAYIALHHDVDGDWLDVSEPSSSDDSIVKSVNLHCHSEFLPTLLCGFTIIFTAYAFYFSGWRIIWILLGIDFKFILRNLKCQHFLYD